MAKSGPIIIMEDDRDDQELMKEAIRELGIKNRIIFFTNGEDAFHHMKTTEEQPFLIISDVRMPSTDGLELKKRIDKDPQLRKKSIPFLFLSTTANKNDVNTAYIETTVQGFFVKPDSYDELKRTLQRIFDYWMDCQHPNVGK